ncbi:MAG: FAD-dependent oxidoreductase [Clostridia bacterium]
MKKFYIIIMLLVIISISLFSGCDNTEKNIEKQNYDVIVVGTDPEGIAAAISTSRNGFKTLLIDKRDSIGGLFTLGWLNFLDMNYSPENELLTRGIFESFYQQIEGVSFDVQTAERVFSEMIEKEDLIKLSLSNDLIEPIMDGNKVIGIRSAKEDVKKNNLATYVIDATQDGDIAALSGAKFTLGQEDIGGPAHGMAVTQVFKLGGIKSDHWQKIRSYLANDDDINTGSTHSTAWGFPELYETYNPKNSNVQMRGLNIARQTDGCVMINALQIFSIDPLDSKSLNKAKDIALDELNYIIPFLQDNIPGMENATLLNVAPELYVRESRHFETLYKVTIDDVLEHRDFEDKIALGSYPVDLQGTSPGENVIIIGNPAIYSIPLRATIPKEVENIFIVSRSAGYDSLAHGSTRVVPVGMCVAEGVGQIVSNLLENNITISDFLENENLIDTAQKELINYGAYLPDFDYPAKITNHPHYEGLKLLRHYGLVQGRYDNDYKLDESIRAFTFFEMYNFLNHELKWNLPVIEDDFEGYLNKEMLLNMFYLETDVTDLLKKNQIFSQIDNTDKLSLGEAAMFLYEINQFD